MSVREYTELPEWIDEQEWEDELYDGFTGDGYGLYVIPVEDPEGERERAVAYFRLERPDLVRAVGWRDRYAVADGTGQADRAALAAWIADRIRDVLTSLPDQWQAAYDDGTRQPLTDATLTAWTRAHVEDGDIFATCAGRRFTLTDPDD